MTETMIVRFVTPYGEGIRTHHVAFNRAGWTIVDTDTGEVRGKFYAGEGLDAQLLAATAQGERFRLNIDPTGSTSVVTITERQWRSAVGL